MGCEVAVDELNVLPIEIAHDADCSLVAENIACPSLVHCLLLSHVVQALVLLDQDSTVNSHQLMGLH